MWDFDSWWCSQWLQNSLCWQNAMEVKKDEGNIVIYSIIINQWVLDVFLVGFSPAHSAGAEKWKNPSSRTQVEKVNAEQGWKLIFRSIVQNKALGHAELVDISFLRVISFQPASCQLWSFSCMNLYGVSLLYWLNFISLVTESKLEHSRLPDSNPSAYTETHAKNFMCEGFPWFSPILYDIYELPVDWELGLFLFKRFLHKYGKQCKTMIFNPLSTVETHWGVIRQGPFSRRRSMDFPVGIRRLFWVVWVQFWRGRLGCFVGRCWVCVWCLVKGLGEKWLEWGFISLFYVLIRNHLKYGWACGYLVWDLKQCLSWYGYIRFCSSVCFFGGRNKSLHGGRSKSK